jgi:serine/threonine-protein kinase HipA
MIDNLEVWLDVDFLPELTRVGSLAHDRGQIRFFYARQWLDNPACFVLDPDLSLDSAPFFPKPESGNFGIFLDSSPDRWGQTLMDRRELLEAKDAGRPARKLYAWDYLIGCKTPRGRGHFVFAYQVKKISLRTISYRPLPLQVFGNWNLWHEN